MSKLLKVLALAAALWAPGFAYGQPQGQAQDRMTLDLPSVPLGTFLKVVTEQSDLKLVTSSELAQKPISVYLPDVSPREALDAVCAVYALEAAESPSGIIIIKEKEAPAAVEQAAAFKLEHVAVKNLKPAVAAMLSEQGRVDVDEATNVLAVRGSDSDIARVRELVSTVDAAPRQVRIETIVAEVSGDAERKLGIMWEPVVSYQGPVRKTKCPFSGEWVDVSEDPDAWTYGLVSFQDFLIRLEAMETDGSAKILATPRITTLDNKAAEIRIQSHIVVATKLTRETEGLDLVTEEPIYADVGVVLKTTPKIHPDGKITLTVQPEVSTAARSSFFEEAVDTFIRTATTTVLLEDGQTIAIGGLLRTDQDQEVKKIPWLSDVPYLGLLFTHKRTLSGKTDLVVFLTPQLLTAEGISEDVLEQKARLGLLPKPEAPPEGEEEPAPETEETEPATETPAE